jgi:uncharacterized protein (TIGR02996 family)
MSDGEAILRAIIDEPGDDLRRLAYADWLEETGEEKYAEFIRAQLALAGVESKCGSGSGDYLCCRSLSCELCPLIRRQNAAWIEVPRVAQKFPREFKWTIYAGQDISPPVAHIRRGFVESVECPLALWLEHGPAIVRRHPVERVVTDREPGSYPGGRFGWHKNRNLDPARFWQVVPAEVFDLLSGPKVNQDDEPDSDGEWTDYATPDEGVDDLSDALIAWAKAEALRAEELPA